MNIRAWFEKTRPVATAIKAALRAALTAAERWIDENIRFRRGPGGPTSGGAAA